MSGSSAGGSGGGGAEGGPSAEGGAVASPAAAVPEDFLVSGRTGRRNALGDILGECAETSTAGLAEALAQISTSDEKPSSSGAKDDSSAQPNS